VINSFLNRFSNLKVGPSKPGKLTFRDANRNGKLSHWERKKRGKRSDGRKGRSSVSIRRVPEGGAVRSFIDFQGG